jgi:hypothetical protein
MPKRPGHSMNGGTVSVSCAPPDQPAEQRRFTKASLQPNAARLQVRVQNVNRCDTLPRSVRNETDTFRDRYVID